MLHATWIILLLSLLYVGFLVFLDLSLWIVLTDGVNTSLYFWAVFCGVLLGLPCYQYYGHKLARLSWLEAAKLTKQQVFRIGLVVFAVVFATKDAYISRLFIATFLGLAASVLFLGNYFFPRFICRFVFRASTVPTLIVGNARDAECLREWSKQQASLGVDPVGLLTDEESPENATAIPILGKQCDLDQVLQERSIALVILIKNDSGPADIRRHLQIARKHGCRVRIYNNYEKEYGHPVLIDHDGPFTFFTLDNEPLENPVNRGLKRALDVAVAVPVVIFILPLLTLLVWFFQRRQAPGPVFYKQPRAGLTRATFQILKFRTMYVGNTAVARQASADDDRIYPFGRFLRRTSLDEMPQFLNVLFGDMSVAGPRPHLQEHDALFSSAFASYHTRHFVKPGITGLAQCHGYRGEILNDDLLRQRIHFDIKYINQWSLLLDLQIIFRTFKQVMFPPKSAY